MTFTAKSLQLNTADRMHCWVSCQDTLHQMTFYMFTVQHTDRPCANTETGYPPIIQSGGKYGLNFNVISGSHGSSSSILPGTVLHISGLYCFICIV